MLIRHRWVSHQNDFYPNLFWFDKCRFNVFNIITKSAEYLQTGTVKLPVKHLRVMPDYVIFDGFPHESRVGVESSVSTLETEELHVSHFIVAHLVDVTCSFCAELYPARVVFTLKVREDFLQVSKKKKKKKKIRPY